jgi:hypothetical protein
MALRTTNIDTTLVRTALSEGNDNVWLLCISNNINMWSRHKPVRDDDPGSHGPAGGDGDFGLDPPDTTNGGSFSPTDWEYKRPRGLGSTPNEYGRLSDFAGYEHLAMPFAYSLAVDNNVPSTLNPVQEDE